MDMEKVLYLQPDTSDPLVAFFGSNEEVENARKLRESIVKEWKSIICAKGFTALEFKNALDNTLILHKSIREGEEWQLSRFDSRGAIGHTIYNHGKSEYHDINDLPYDLYSECSTHNKTRVTVLID